MRQGYKTLIFIIISIALFSCGSNQSKNDKDSRQKKKVSIVFPVSIDAFDKLKSGFEEICKDSFDIRYFSAEGDPSKFETVIQSALLYKPDYLVTIGTQITNTAFGAKFVNSLPIVIAGAISSPELVDALKVVGLEPPRKSEVAIISDSPKESIYDLFYKAVNAFLPNAKKVGILYNPAEVNSKGTADKISKVLRQNGLAIFEGVINNSEDIEKVTGRLLAQDVDAIIIPHDKNVVTNASTIVKKCDERHIPVFSLDDGTVKKDGVCIGVSVSYKIIGSLTAKTLLNIDKKETKASNLPIISVENAKIYVNLKKLNDLKIRLPISMNSLIETVNE